MNPSNLTNQDLINLIREIEKTWEIDPVNRIIRRKKTNNWTRFLQLIGIKRKKYPIKVLYRYAKEFFFQSENMPFPFPFNNPEIKDFYKLANGYQIPIPDRKYITHGPLYDQDGSTIIIPKVRLFFLDRKGVRIVLTLILLTSATVALCTNLFGLGSK